MSMKDMLSAEAVRRIQIKKTLLREENKVQKQYEQIANAIEKDMAESERTSLLVEGLYPENAEELKKRGFIITKNDRESRISWNVV
jgi:fructosamine-3-kinase